jgi:hypothetical protein
MTTYTSASAYYDTSISANGILNTWTPRYVPASPSDNLVVISDAYDSRPDLMAFDLYGYAELWWIFAQRNPGTLSADPLGNFTAGTAIYIPDPSAVKAALEL